MLNYFDKFPRNFRLIFLAQTLFNMGFYSLKSMFVLYALRQFHIDQNDIFSLFASFMTLCYVTSFLGSYIADKLIGAHRTLIWGGILTMTGILLFYLPHSEFLYLSLALISLGCGFFKPNFSAAANLLFDNPKDVYKPKAFSNLYVAMNIGGLFGTLIIGLLENQNNWYYGLAFITLSFALSATVFYRIPYQSISSHSRIKPALLNTTVSLSITILSLIILCWLYKNIESFNYALQVIIIIIIVFFCYILYQCNSLERLNLFKLIFYYILFIFSCALIEQMYSSLVIFINTKVDRQLCGIKIPSSFFMSINPALVLLFSSSATLMPKLTKHAQNYTSLTKFTIGYGFLSTSFGILMLGNQYIHQDSVSVIWIFISFVLQTLGEWFIVPAGFTLVAQYAPARYLSTIISFWLTGIAWGHVVAGKLANQSMHSLKVKLIKDTDSYGQFFTDLFILSIIIFVILLIYSCKTIFSRRLDYFQNKKP